MTWHQIEPELYYHAQLPDRFTASDKGLIQEKALYLARSIFADIYHDRVDFEIVIEDGSIRVKIIATIAALLTFLAKYGDIRSGAEYLYKDLRTGYGLVAERLEQTHLVGAPICVQRRVGVVGRIDQTLDDYQNHKITREQCETKLVELFEIINKSPHRQDLVRELTGYINTKYGNTFPWDDLDRTLNPRVAIRPRRHDEDDK